MAAKSTPTAVRLSETTKELIEAEAKRTNRSKSAVLAAVADEGIRQRAFPGIGFRSGPDGTRDAWVMGTGLDVWEMVMIYRDYGESIEDMVADYEFGEQHVRLALDYYRRFPEEIDDALAENEAVYREYGDRWPTFAVPPE